MAELADLLGLAWDDRLTAAIDCTDAAPPHAEPHAWVLADMLIAGVLEWDCAVLLLLAEGAGTAFSAMAGIARRADALLAAESKVRTKDAMAVIGRLFAADAMPAL